MGEKTTMKTSLIIHLIRNFYFPLHTHSRARHLYVSYTYTNVGEMAILCMYDIGMLGVRSSSSESFTGNDTMAFNENPSNYTNAIGCSYDNL